jgi:RND family efflux transporter MFP subunit
MTALFSDITIKRTSLLASKNAYNQALKDLDLINAGTDPYKIKAQSAIVAQARAQLASAESGLSKTVLKAPFAGIVNTVNLSEGEIAIAGRTVFNVIAVDGYEIEAKVPEADIVKIKVGAPVEVTLDAYGKGIIFPATITRINPGATTEGTVPVYKIIVTFSGKDERVKQGMTANVQVLSESKSQVIAIPARFVKIINGEVGTVSLQSNGVEEVRTVQLGIRGADGLIEIRSGLVEGDVIAAPSTAVRESQKQTTTTN